MAGGELAVDRYLQGAYERPASGLDRSHYLDTMRYRTITLVRMTACTTTMTPT